MNFGDKSGSHQYGWQTGIPAAGSFDLPSVTTSIMYRSEYRLVYVFSISYIANSEWTVFRCLSVWSLQHLEYP